MAFLNSIDQVRSIDWDKGYLWDIKFPQAPAPFNDWFPASEYTLSTGTGTSLDLPFYMKNYKFPQMTASSEITLTFYDDNKHTLTKWILEWFNRIYDTSTGVLTLAEACKEIHLCNLDYAKNTQDLRVLYVYPDGAYNEGGSSDSSNPQKTLTLNVVGSK